MKIIITKENVGWDISAWEDEIRYKTAYAENKSDAIRKAIILSEYYDEHGQPCNIEILKS